MGRMLKALQEVGASPGQMPRALTRSELETFGLWQLIEPQKTADPCPADESAGQLASRADAAATQCDPLSTPDIDSPTIAKEALVDRARTAAAADADPFPEMPAWQCLNESLAELIGSSGFAAPSTVATVPESEAIVAVTDVAECVIPAELAEHPAPPPLHTVGPPKPAAEPLASTPCQARPAESLPSAPGPTRIGEPGKQDRARYLELADRVLARVPLRRPASLVFTGTDCEHVTAAMLADLAVALTDRLPGEVLVVDADFESPRMAGLLGVDPGLSLGDVLLGGANWQDVVRRAPTPRLSLLPGGSLLAADPQTLRGMRLARLVDQWQERYQLVLLNAAPGANPYLAGLAGRLDGAYLVVHLQRTSYRAATQAAARLRRYGLQVLGCILTAIDG